MFAIPTSKGQHALIFLLSDASFWVLCYGVFCFLYTRLLFLMLLFLSQRGINRKDAEAPRSRQVLDNSLRGT